MNEEIVRALLRVKHAIKDNVLTNANLVDTFLKDMFPDDKYVGDRMLLLTLMHEGLPLKARDGCFDDETALNAESRRIAQTYHMDEDWVRKALLTWRYVAQADETTTASGRVDADFLQLLPGSMSELKEVEASPVSNCGDERLSKPLSNPLPNLKEVEASPVSVPQTSGGGGKGRSLVLWAVLIFAGLTVWHFAWYSVTGESASSYLAKKRYAAEQEKLKGAQNAMPDDTFIELCKEGTADEVRKALVSGANVNDRDEYDGMTALMSAALYNPNPEVVKVLLEGGANVNARGNVGMTVLMHAARWNPNPEVVKVLLEGGANVNARDNVGMTALMYAAWKNSNPEVVKALLKNGADVRAVDKGGNNAIWWAQQREKGNKEEIIQILKGYPSAQNAMPDDAFLELCKKGTAEEVRSALASGANVNAKDNDSGTALMMGAIWNSNPEVVKALLAGGADANAKNKYKVTALMYAAKWNLNPEVIKVLLEGRSNALAVDEDGHDAFWWAQYNPKGNKEKIIQILKEYASSTTPAKAGKSGSRTTASGEDDKIIVVEDNKKYAPSIKPAKTGRPGHETTGSGKTTVR